MTMLGPIWPAVVAQKAVKTTRFVLKPILIAGAFLFGALKIRGLVVKSKKKKAEKQQQAQIAGMYGAYKKQQEHAA